MKNKIGTWIMALGVLCICLAVGLAGYNLWEDQRAGDAAAEKVTQIKRVIKENKKQETTDSDETEQEADTVQVLGDQYLGCLLIPSAGLEIPVLAEFSMDGLEYAAACYSGSIKTHDLVIAGHNYSRIFRPIKQLSVGTKVQIMDADGNVYNYQVTELTILQPNQVQVMTEVSDQWDLSLFTCTTGGRSRYVLRCRQTD